MSADAPTALRRVQVTRLLASATSVEAASHRSRSLAFLRRLPARSEQRPVVIH